MTRASTQHLSTLPLLAPVGLAMVEGGAGGFLSIEPRTFSPHLASRSQAGRPRLNIRAHGKKVPLPRQGEIILIQPDHYRRADLHRIALRGQPIEVR